LTKRAVIIGGGIAGLAAAYRLHLGGLERGESIEVVLLESTSELGGKISTLVGDDGVFEEGPSSFLDPQPGLEELISHSGVELISASADAKRRYLCRAGTLRELSPNPWKLYRTGLLSGAAILRMLGERFVGQRRSDHGNRPSEAWGDESVYSFIKRRFGLRAADLLAAPAVSGVFAGDPQKLSLSAAFPKLSALEAQHGSVLKGLQVRRRPGHAAPQLHAPRGGMQSLPAALAERAKFTVHKETSVTRLASAEGRWVLQFDSDTDLTADAVVVATPASAAAALLMQSSRSAALALSKITAPHLAVVNLVYEQEDSQRAPVGFGALHTDGDGSNILGVLHESHLFPQRRSDGRLHLRAMIGGSRRPDLETKSDSELLGLATSELQTIHGFKQAPSLARIKRWRQSIPQYHLGHARLISDALQGLRGARTPPIALAGNYLSGVSLSDTAASGRIAGEDILHQLEG
jgi:protoporphyrinogen/coproporphyrinogen III oxidase